MQGCGGCGVGSGINTAISEYFRCDILSVLSYLHWPHGEVGMGRGRERLLGERKG